MRRATSSTVSSGRGTRRRKRTGRSAEGDTADASRAPSGAKKASSSTGSSGGGARPPGNKKGSDRSSSAGSGSTKPASTRSSSDKPSTKSSGDRSSGDRSSGDKSTGDKSSADKSPSNRQGADRKASNRGRKQRSRRKGAADRRKVERTGDERNRILFQRLVSVMPDAVVTLKASGSLGQWSVGAARLTGRRRREVQRRGFASIFKESDVCKELLAEIDARGRVTDREVTLRSAAGDEVSTRIYGTRLTGVRADGAPRGRRHKSAGSRGGTQTPDDDRYLLVLHDQTEVDRIRSRLIETEKLSAMAKIAGSVAHEFRNPLNALFLNTDLLEDELEGREEIRASIAPTLLAIREEIERLNQIITHYLSLSKIASAEPKAIDLSDVVRDFAADWQDRAQERAIKLRVRTDDATHPISGDLNQVRRVMVNLVENAFDAILGAAQEGRRAGTVTLLLRRMRRSVKLTVKDNGPGIPGEHRERVFEPFFTSKSGGSGLGLYLVREIVLASGGSMSLSSAEGRGTSVSVRWPLVEPPPKKRPARKKAVRRKGSSSREGQS